MDLLFLGTGAGMPAKARNVTSVALRLLEERQAVWLFDCGEATQHQILHTSIKPRKIEKIFITHMHGDHIYGLPGLLGSRSFQGGEEPLVIYGPSGIKDYVEASLRLSYTHLKYPLEIVEFEDGTVFEDSQFKVEAKRLSHGVPSYGYRITEKDLPGMLMVDKLKEAGVQPGPLYKKLKNGESVTLEDGRTLHGEDFLGAPKKGRIVTILGDTRTCPQVEELAANADLLVHESTFGKDDEQLAYEYFHSSTTQAARAAFNAGVKKLVLTHISARYQNEDQHTLLSEASAIFPNTAVAEDFSCFEVVRHDS
ncbi:ribonuclease Z [Peribacillus frigoritolerans]|uniref:ribonuclease Z n=1 Tax=Peribacillus frigoritolerans TaxID=450367 RepID=UPI00105AA0BB|nr:ribonuclease Z [Peribacillus frigoritolerans]TDL82448.1 ribonuclease Z [Peribacillus frigoritolerans]